MIGGRLGPNTEWNKPLISYKLSDFVKSYKFTLRFNSRLRRIDYGLGLGFGGTEIRDLLAHGIDMDWCKGFGGTEIKDLLAHGIDMDWCKGFVVQSEARELREISRYEDGEIIEEAEGAGGEPGTCGVYEASVAEVTKEGIEKDRTLCSVRAEKGEYDNILSEKYNGGHRNASVMEKFELTASSLTCNEWKEEWEQMCEACWDAKELELIEMKKKLRRKWKKDICKTVVSIEKMDKIEKLFEAWEANADSVERQKRLEYTIYLIGRPKKKKARGGETGEEHIKGVQSVLQSKAMRMGEPEARKWNVATDRTWEMRDNMLRIRLKDMADKLDSMRKKGMMRGSDIWIDDDPTHRETQIQKWLRRVADKDTKDKRQAKVTYMKIERNGDPRGGKLTRVLVMMIERSTLQDY
ncbi:hypothetical protein PV325_005684 [Microctonus aethiopoides]|nr:hypothetical protein PV325_005684 [Microctonus aethiopoides]